MNKNEFNFTELEFIDIHYHASPDLYERRHNVLSTGMYYKKLKGAVILKSHLGSTAVQASLAQQLGLPVFPSLVLNQISGGIDYKNVIRALSEYTPLIPSKLIVHFPTITGRYHQSKLNREYVYPNFKEITSKPETIFNYEGKLRVEVIDILKVAKDYPIILSSGHASKEETYALIEACLKYNVPALLLNQPANPLTGFNARELIKIANYPFLWIEQTALTYLLKYQNLSDFKTVLKEVPNVIYNSDLGQTSQIDIKEWLTRSNQWFLKFDISRERKQKICLENPLHLLKI